MEEEIVFTLDKFEGSLDLLLYLVSKHKMDITDIRISVIADEFLDYINRMKKLDVNIASDFMIMASTLMEMKSKALLPRKTEEDRKKLEEMKSDLTRRLIEYKKMKELGAFLKEKLDEVSKLFPAKVDMERISSIKDGGKTKESLERFKKIFSVVGKELSLREKVYKVRGEIYSMENKMEWIKEKMSLEKSMNLIDLLRYSKDKLEMLVMFLALLELVKLGLVEITGCEDSFMLSWKEDAA